MYFFIVDSRLKDSEKLTNRLRQDLERADLRGRLIETGEDDPKIIAQNICAEHKQGTIVAVGDNQIASEVIDGVTHEGIVFGLIPTGQSSLGRQLNITDWQQAIEMIARRRVEQFSLIQAGNHNFLHRLTIGFNLSDPESTKTLNLSERTRQIRSTARERLAYQPINCELDVDKKLSIKAAIFTLSVTNLNLIHSDMQGLAVSFNDKPNKKQLWRQILKPRDDEWDASSRFMAHHLTLSTTKPEQFTLDGRPAGHTPLEIKVSNRSLRVITGNKPDQLF